MIADPVSRMPSPAPGLASGGTVLVADASRTILAIAVGALRREGLTVQATGDAAAALAFAEAVRPAAMLVDAGLALPDGRRLLDALAALDGSAGRVVALLGSDSAAALPPGTALLRKPFGAAELGAALARPLARPTPEEPIDPDALGLVWPDPRDPLFHRVVRLCLEEMRARPAIVARALHGPDRAAIQREAHILKGVASNIGALPLASAAAALEAAADAASAAELAAMAGLLQHHVARTAAALRTLLGPQPG